VKKIAPRTIKGRNPFADIPRAQRADEHGVDVQAIVRAICAASGRRHNVVPPVYTANDKSLDVHLPFDRDGAKALLKDAGYTDGFDVQLDWSQRPLHQ